MYSGISTLRIKHLFGVFRGFLSKEVYLGVSTLRIKHLFGVFSGFHSKD